METYRTKINILYIFLKNFSRYYYILVTFLEIASAMARANNSAQQAGKRYARSYGDITANLA